MIGFRQACGINDEIPQPEQSLHPCHIDELLGGIGNCPRVLWIIAFDGQSPHMAIPDERAEQAAERRVIDASPQKHHAASASTSRRRGTASTGMAAYRSFTASVIVTPAKPGSQVRPVRSNNGALRSTNRQLDGGR
jgi:hypothetical protein